MTEQENLIEVGIAQIDITPEYPIRLNGYGSRQTVSEGIIQRIWAKALVIGGDNDEPVLMLTVENCGDLPDESFTEDLALRIEGKTGIPRENFVCCLLYTHAQCTMFNKRRFVYIQFRYYTRRTGNDRPLHA